MKIILSSIASLSLLAWGTGAANADLLSNGNLDDISVSDQTLATPTGWDAVANKSSSGAFSDGMSSETFANILDPNGYGLFFKAFQGSAGDLLTASISQIKPATAGLTYTLTGWAGAGAGYIGLTDSTVKSEFQINFLDVGQNVIGGATLDLTSNGQHHLGDDNNGNPFGYFDYSLSATAPAGTASVQTGAWLINAYGNPAGGDQAFVVDAFTLAVPEPTTIALVGLGLATLVGFRRQLVRR